MACQRQMCTITAHTRLPLASTAEPTLLSPCMHQVASTAHSYFDVCVELVLRVTMFHSASSAGNFPMTIGFMAKDQLERTGLLSESKDAKVTWQKTFHGGCTVLIGVTNTCCLRPCAPGVMQ